jgi:DNA polymerase-3 subunit beta
MKIELHLTQFKRAIGLAERVAKKNMTLPVLSCIVFEVQKNNLLVKSTNLDVGIEVSIPVKSDADGVVAVPAQTISSFISQIHDIDATIKMELVNNNLNISSARSKVVIKTMPADDFPSIPRIADSQSIAVSRDSLIKGLKSVWYSASISSVKPELSSVFVYKDNEDLVCVATDSFRLAEKRVKVKTDADMPDMLIPYKNIADILRMLEDGTGSVSITTNKNLMACESDGVYLASRIIDGTFPDYKQIIPKSYSTESIVLKQDIINALKVSNIFVDKFNQIKLHIDPKHSLFEIQTKNADVGENSTHIEAQSTGEDITINFNGKYVTDCFQSIDADSVSLQLGGMNRPMVIRPASGDGTFMYLVMPMNR